LKLKIANGDKVNLTFQRMGKNGQKGVSHLANHRLQPLGHLSIARSKTRPRPALKLIMPQRK
jgi:hypothetical protein